MEEVPGGTFNEDKRTKGNPRFPSQLDELWLIPPLYLTSTCEPTPFYAMVMKATQCIEAELQNSNKTIISFIVKMPKARPITAATSFSTLETTACAPLCRYMDGVFPNIPVSSTGLGLRDLQDAGDRPALLLKIAAITQVILRCMEAAVRGEQEPRELISPDEHPLVFFTIDEWKSIHWNPGSTDSEVEQLTALTPLKKSQQEETQDLEEMLQTVRDQLKTAESTQQVQQAYQAQGESIQQQLQALFGQVQQLTQHNVNLQSKIEDLDLLQGTRKRSATEAGLQTEGNSPILTCPDESAPTTYNPNTPEIIAARRKDMWSTPGVMPSQWHRAMVDQELVERLRTGKTVTTNQLYTASMGYANNSMMDIIQSEGGKVTLTSSTSDKHRVTKFSDFAKVAKVLHDCLLCLDRLAAVDIQENFLAAMAIAYDAAEEDIEILTCYSDRLLKVYLDARFYGQRIQLGFDLVCFNQSKVAVESLKRIAANKRTQHTSPVQSKTSSPPKTAVVPKIWKGEVPASLAATLCLNWQHGRPCAVKTAAGTCVMKHHGPYGGNPNATKSKP